MKLKSVFISAVIVATATLSSCSAQQPAQPFALVPAELLEPEQPPPPESVLDRQPADVRSAIATYQRSGRPPTLRDGITTRFPYEADAAFLVLCEALGDRARKLIQIAAKK
jgi:hypothetical protein